MKKILFFDSGSGGINVMAHCVRSGVGGDMLYYADTKDAPYGDKSKEELQQHICKKIDQIYKFFPFEIVVFACNTLTTSAIDFVRKRYPLLTFVGSEPALKPARERYQDEDILLMATNRTLANIGFDGVCVADLPKLIDENLLSLENLDNYLERELSKYANKKAVVLGCTHYLAVEKKIQNIFPDAELFSSNEGIARRLKTLAGEGEHVVQFMESGSENISIFSKYFQNLIDF